MFQNVGGKIKEFAKRYITIRTLSSFLIVFIGGFAVSYFLSSLGVNNSDFMWIWVALLVIVPVSTYYRAKMQAIQQYAFGELVECTAQIRDMMSENMWEEAQS